MDNNFIVSARKYRPQTFETVVGQSHITTTLKNAIARGQLAHAYLFCGPRGVGKTTCARIFAKTINCLHPTAEGDACGECESCRSFNEGRSFTIHELDAASNNSVDNIRDLTDQVRVPPQIGKYSVYIIDEVHMLSQAAFNAFLKTLEEPPQHAIFILATTEKHKIIPTILSRCQIYDFQRIRIEDTVAYLKTIAQREGVSFDDEALHLIARKADGGMRDALSMFDKAVSFCGGNLEYKEVAATLNVLDYDTYFTTTSAILEGDYKSAVMIFDEVLRKGFSGQTFAAGLASHFRDLLMCKDLQTLPLLEITGSLLERYKEQCSACDIGFLFGAIAHLAAVDGGFRTATNQRLHVELGLMRLAGMCQKKNFEVAVPTLPELNREGATTTIIPPAAQSAATATSTAAQVSTPAHTGQVTPPAPTTGRVEQVVAQPAATVATAPMAAPSVATSATAKEPEATTPKPVAPMSPKAKSSIFGGSISDIMRGRATDEEEGEKAIIHYDSQSQQKIVKSWERFIERLTMEHPRLGHALKETRVSGHTLSVAVTTDFVREEVLRSQPEITALLQECCGIDGSIILDVTVSEEQNKTLPTRPVDRVRFLTEINAEVQKLINDLDLDVQ